MPKYFQPIRADHSGRWNVRGLKNKNYGSACLADGRPIIVVSNHHLCSRVLEAVDIYCHQSRVRSREHTFASTSSLRTLDGWAVY
jgi:hypothetical protein